MPAFPADEPSLEQLRNQAKDLRRAVLAGEAGALAEVAERPAMRPARSRCTPRSWRWRAVTASPAGPASSATSRSSSATAASPTACRPTARPAWPIAFLRLVSLYYADDQPERWAEGRRLLAEHPEITQASVHAAAAAADTEALRRILAADPGAARREGGPFRWPPLIYLAYARHDPQIGEDAVLTSARLLLDARRRPERRLPLARPAHPVHRTDRGVRRGGAGPGPPAPASALARPGPPAARSGRRPERRPGAVQPDVRAR